MHLEYKSFCNKLGSVYLRPLQAKCVKTGPGTHSCQCLTGWREDGDECQPINNCDASDGGGCHPNATCIYVGPGQVTSI